MTHNPRIEALQQELRALEAVYRTGAYTATQYQRLLVLRRMVGSTLL